MWYETDDGARRGGCEREGEVSVLKVTNLAYSRAGRKGGKERWLEEEDEA